MQLKYKSIEELKATITIPDLSKSSIKTLINSMKKLSIQGTDRSNNDAKEDAYIYFYKYMLLFNHVHRSKEFKVFRNDLKDATEIMARLERLTKELSASYDILAQHSREAEREAKQAAEAQLKNEEHLRNELNNKLTSPAQQIGNRYWIGVQQLIDCIKSSQQQFSYIIWDTRPTSDYNDSHLTILHNVNIPMSEIPKGISANALEKVLSNSSQQEWKNRATYNFNILMGVDDSPERISADVQQLYDIICKWDPNTSYKYPVILLNRGYSHFCFLYPIHCSSISIISSKSLSSGAVDLDNVEYPFLHDEEIDQMEEIVEKFTDEVVVSDVSENIENDLNEMNISAPSNETISPPMIDRSKKPSSTIRPMEEIIEPEPPTLEEDVKEAPVESPVVPTLEKIVPDKPVFDRTMKPKTKKPKSSPRVQLYVSPNLDNYRHIVGRSPAYNNGTHLTGFSNDRNFCYLNSVMQALLHVKRFRDFFLNDSFVVALNRPKVHQNAAITLEIAALIKFYWEGRYSVLHLRKLKALMGVHCKRFQMGNQEDSHEFYTAILQALHEELAYNELPPAGADACTTTYYSFMKNQPSFIYSQFFGIANLNITCNACNQSVNSMSLFGCLSVDITSDSIVGCIANTYNTENVTSYKCEKCKRKSGAKFRYRMVTPPSIVVVHLKRFTMNSTYQEYVKDETEVSFNSVLKMPQVTLGDETFYYRLSAVCIHTGTLTSGHYQAIVYDTRISGWVKFNDSCAEIIPDFTSVKGIYSQAYLLYYEKIKEKEVFF